ncbi:MAG: polysaccharide pyruvyl transferase family protein [Cyanobacteria bacterium K_Offshore_surface_m2_239]|nr:polysaccharide pyruvyl transferase family protein [Cyanobacteria bacterium K_Offshore_surface_m2_239]
MDQVRSINLFAFGFTPTTKTASSSRWRRAGWKLKRIKQLCFHCHNFGDFLSYQLVSALSEKGVRIAGQDEGGKLLAVGSILWSLRDLDVIWGSGAHREGQIPRRRIANCFAVRGPLTLAELQHADVVSGECDPLFFDPGILVSFLYPDLCKADRISGKTVVIPHYTDVVRVRQWQKRAGIRLEVVDPLDHPYKVAKQIVRAERVISSSLHGLIFADAFGRSAVPLRLDGNREPSFKYVDYYQGSGRSTPRFSSDLSAALDRHPSPFHYRREDLSRFLASFPYPMKSAFTRQLSDGPVSGWRQGPCRPPSFSNSRTGPSVIPGSTDFSMS